MLIHRFFLLIRISFFYFSYFLMYILCILSFVYFFVCSLIISCSSCFSYSRKLYALLICEYNFITLIFIKMTMIYNVHRVALRKYIYTIYTHYSSFFYYYHKTSFSLFLISMKIIYYELNNKTLK